jgi:pimeloyl-ACP methyl ester carboxylesterase
MSTPTDKLDPRERHFRIRGPADGLELFLRHLAPARPVAKPRAVLFVHGMSFPSALSIAHRFDGRSWRDELCDAGFQVWGLDFYGFGGSDRYPEMHHPAGENAPLGPSTAEPPPPLKAWRLVSVPEQWERFTEDVPSGQPPVLSEAHFRVWAERFLDSDEASRRHDPPSVQVPNGMAAEIAATRHGRLAYDPGEIRAPVAIVRGEWDTLCTDADARWLFDALAAAPVKRDVKISRATHLMHLEEGRHALYRETLTFLEGEQHPMSNPPENLETKAHTIPGYGYGKPEIGRSPVSLEELRQIEQAAGWSEEDAAVLQRHGAIFQEHAEHMVDAWRAVIGAQPHLARWFFGPDGKPDEEYKARVKRRFVQWVTDAAFRPHDQAWLDYQEEIGLRHTPAKKNRTDGAHTPPVVPLRYLIAFCTTITTATRPFFVDAGLKGEELKAVQDAWAMAVQLHVTLWERPYASEGLW